MQISTATATIVHAGDNRQTERFPPEIKKKQAWLLLPLLFTDSHQGNKAKSIIKSIQIQNEDMQLFLFTDDMILYIENPQRCINTP